MGLVQEEVVELFLQLAKDIGIIDDDDDEKDIQSPSDDESNHSGPYQYLVQTDITHYSDLTILLLSSVLWKCKEHYCTLVNEHYPIRLLQLKYSLYDLFFNMRNPDYVQDNHWLNPIDLTLSDNKALNTNKSELNLSYIALIINDLA